MVEGVPVGGGDAEAQGRGTELQRLPLSLDSVGYLKFATGRLHLFGNYAMPRPGKSLLSLIDNVHNQSLFVLNYDHLHQCISASIRF